ncbi:unnamed protein product, partial [Oppiella nova]
MFAIVVAISSAIAVVCRLVVVFRATRRTTDLGDEELEERLGFAVRTTEVLFGREVYARLRRKDHPFQRDVKDLWKSVPEEGVRHVISYVDTAPDDATKRTLLLLHGMPGGIIDWEPFVRHFGREYRLLVPQLPDFHFSRTSGHFWHSNEERAALVTAFAAALGVNRVNALVCHSGGNPVALALIEARELDVGSLVMITPPGFQWISSAQRQQGVRMCRTASSRFRRLLFLFLFTDYVMRLFGVRETLVRNTTRDQFFGMTFLAVFSFDERVFRRRYQALKDRKLPVLFVMAEKDGLFPQWKFLKTLEWMGVAEDDRRVFTEVDANGKRSPRTEA